MEGTGNDTFLLDNAQIAQAMDAIRIWLDEQDIEHKSSLSLLLSIEEILLRWQDHFGEEQVISLSLGKRFMRPCITMELKGEACDPTLSSEEGYDWNQRVLSRLGLAPEYAHRHGVNRLSFRIKPQSSSAARNMVLAVAAAVVLSLLGKMLFPGALQGIVQGVVFPLRSTLLGMISAVAVPMVFLSVMLGICSSGSATEFGKIGNGTMLSLTGRLFLSTLMIALAVFPMFHLEFAQTAFSADQLSGTLQMILDIFPKNLVEPFYTGNTLQVIVVAVALGVALLVLGDRASEIRTLAEKADAVISLLMEWVCKLIAPIIFLILLETLWGSNVSSLLKLWKPMLIAVVSCVLLPAIQLLLVSKKYRIAPMKLLRKVLPPFMIALATSSSAATYNENMECAQKRLGIDRKIAGFGLPAGMVIYKPASAINLLICVLYGAEQFGVSCSAAWLLLAWLAASLLSIALPPIPGGTMAIYTVIFLQMGIPTDAAMFAIAMDIVVDRFVTASNIAQLHLALIGLANKYHMLKREILQS